METFKGDAKSYEDAKLKVLEAILELLGIEIQDKDGEITVLKDGEGFASLKITRNNYE